MNLKKLLVSAIALGSVALSGCAYNAQEWQDHFDESKIFDAEGCKAYFVSATDEAIYAKAPLGGFKTAVIRANRWGQLTIKLKPNNTFIGSNWIKPHYFAGLWCPVGSEAEVFMTKPTQKYGDKGIWIKMQDHIKYYPMAVKAAEDRITLK